VELTRVKYHLAGLLQKIGSLDRLQAVLLGGFERDSWRSRSQFAGVTWPSRPWPYSGQSPPTGTPAAGVSLGGALRAGHRSDRGWVAMPCQKMSFRAGARVAMRLSPEATRFRLLKKGETRLGGASPYARNLGFSLVCAGKGKNAAKRSLCDLAPRIRKA